MLKSLVIFQTIVIVALAKPNYGRGVIVAESCPTGMVKELGRCVWPDRLWKGNTLNKPCVTVGDVDRCPTGMVRYCIEQCCECVNKFWKSNAIEPGIGDFPSRRGNFSAGRCPRGMVRVLHKCVYPDRLKIMING
ncbi:unnamed protein product [Plutella xylostella]|uniref:(diamondback moth) hypothetical protein n=1 Tax=Plutella xylostella TaxID=51655 RepID=A0A8S4G5V3_PLUXY|nr:unnamed protein product [Plutella xylostella]